MDNNRIASKDRQPSLSNPTILHRPQSEEDGNRATKRPRASKPKVKSGCQTCKARRIKCDETKPMCLRCQKFGKPCEGYGVSPAPSRGPIQIQPRLSLPILYRPSVSINVTENDSRYFEVFIDDAAEELSGYFDGAFWAHIALQESHQVAAIRHALIALGALNKSLSLAPLPSLKVNVIQTLEKHHHEQAVLHYHKAIQMLNQYLSNSQQPQLRTALIACILFVCFETIQGSFASTIQQSIGGLKMLRSYYKSRVPPAGKHSTSTIDYASAAGKVAFDVDQSDTVISAQIKDFFESDAWHEQPQLSFSPLTTSQHDFINQSAISNQGTLQPWTVDVMDPPASTSDPSTSTFQEDRSNYANHPSMLNPNDYEFQSSYIDFKEPDYQNGRGSSSWKIPSDNHDRRQLGQTYLKGSLKRSFSQEQRPHPQAQQPQTLSTRERDIYSSRGRTMSTLSLNDTSSAYSSDSGSYREPSPHFLQPNNSNTGTSILQSSLSASFSHSISNSLPVLKRSHTQPELPIVQQTLEIENPIIQTFVRLTNPGLFFTMPPSIPILYWDIHHLFSDPIPTHFSSFESAQHTWDFLMDRCLAFYSTTLFNRVHKPQKLPSVKDLALQHAQLLAEISSFENALQLLLDEGDGPPNQASSLLVSLYTHSTRILLSQTTNPSEMAYDAFGSSFQHIIDTCKAILLLPTNKSTSIKPIPSTRFSFSIGIIPPLHLTALKCRNPVLRRQAVELLLKSARQEGLWDSIICGRIGRWLIGCEEDGLGAWDDAENVFGDQDTGIVVGGGDSKGKGKGNAAYGEIGSGRGKNIIILPQRSRKADAGMGIHVGHGSVAESKRKEWFVPEKNRAQLTSISFHIPDRYVKVKCRRGGEGGEFRETVIAW